MHRTIKILVLQMMLGTSLPAFSCSIIPDGPPKKSTIDIYKESDSVVTARVTRISPLKTKMSQIGIEEALRRLTSLRTKLETTTDDRFRKLLPESIASAEKDYLKRKNNAEYAEIQGVRNYSGPIKVEMTVNKSFKGNFNEGDTLHFTANRDPFREWGLCGVIDFYEDYLYSLKSNQQVVLYYQDDYVSHWTKFENTSEQHAKLNRYSTADTFIGKVTTLFKSFISSK